MIEISALNSVANTLDFEELQHILQIFLTELKQQDKFLEVHFTNEQEIQKLNFKYRGKNKPTDILSWSYIENDPDSNVLGELILCFSYIEKQAKENNWDVKTETVRMLAHGCCHLIGHDHENSPEEDRKMLELEIKLLNTAGYTGLYDTHTTSD